MQVIRPLLSLSTHQLGIVKNFDIPNKVLLKPNPNFQLGLKNTIHPLGAKARLGLHTKSPFLTPLRNNLRLSLHQQEQSLIDEKVWNSENWNTHKFTKFSPYELDNELDSYISSTQENILISHQSEAVSHINHIIEDNLITIITDSLPITAKTDFDNKIQDQDDNFSITNIANANINNDRDINQDFQIQEQLGKKSKSKSKDLSTKKSKNKKTSNKNLNQAKKSQESLPVNTKIEANNIQSSQDEIFRTSIKEDLVEAEDLSPAVSEKQHTLAHQEIYRAAKETLKQEPISEIEQTRVFQEIEELDNIINPANLSETNAPKLDDIELGNAHNNSSINNQLTQDKNPSVVEDFKDNRELISNEVNSQIIPDLLLQMKPDNLPSNRFIENRNDFNNLIDSQKDVLEIPREKVARSSPFEAECEQPKIQRNKLVSNIIENQPPANTIENKPTLATEVYSTDSTEIINASDNLEISINHISEKENINSQYTQRETSLSPISEIARENEVTEDQAINPINYQDNDIQGNKDNDPVINFDNIVTNANQDNLELPDELNHSVPLEDPNIENADAKNIVTHLINGEQNESSETQQTNLYPQISINDNLDIPSIQKQVQQSNIANNSIESKDPVERKKSLSPEAAILQEQTTTKFLPLNLENHSPETPSVNNLLNTTDLSPKDNSINLLSKLPDNLPAPKGYATGGLVKQTNISENSQIEPSDTVPVMLTPGEFVINARDTQKNINVLRHINSGGTLSEDITTANVPDIEPVASKETSNIVDNLPNNRATISPRLINKPISSPEAHEINTSRMIETYPFQFNTFDNSEQKLTNKTTDDSHDYSPPPLIFRKANTSSRATSDNFNNSLPSQWGSVEELLNSSQNEYTIFNPSQINHSQANFDNSINLEILPVSAKESPTSQRFTDNGKVAESDIATNIKPITEAIQIHTESANMSNSFKEENNEEVSSDLETLSREIYSRLRQKLEIERERYGVYSGRLPW